MAEHRRTRSMSAEQGDVAPPAELAKLIGYHLRLAQEASFQAIRQALGKSDLKPGWYTLLTILAAHPGATPTELSRLCGRDRSTLTTTLKSLTARGLVVAKPNSDDQRSYGVLLTRAGRQMLERLQAVARAHDARLDAIAGEHKPLLIALLRRIANELGNHQPASHKAAARRPAASLRPSSPGRQLRKQKTIDHSTNPVMKRGRTT